MAESASPTFEFADGVLSIATTLIRMRLRWRPAPLAEELFPGARRWRPCWPEFRLLRPAEEPRRNRFDRDIPLTDREGAAAAAKAAAFAAFRNELPDDLVIIVEPFASHQWALLVFLRDQPRAMELVRSNPVLTHALANSHLFRGTRPEAAAVQAIWHHHHKQRQILAWLGFPDAEAVVRLLRRIPPSSASPPMLRLLRNVLLANPRVLDLLTHLQTINAPVLELVTHQHALAYVTPNLLRDVARQTDAAFDPPVGDMLTEGLSLLEQITPGRMVQPFQRADQVHEFYQAIHAEFQARQEQRATMHRELARRAEMRRVELREQHLADRRTRAAERAAWREAHARRRAREAEIRRHPFPTPPIPGTAEIEPITTDEELKKEGGLQANCVGTYGTLVDGGTLYIYRVLAPQRATLSIRRDADGNWRRAELKARGNRRVRAATAKAVDQWLDQYRVSV